MTLIERMYGMLPPLGRDLAASLRGLQLRATRYDRDLEARVEAAFEREYWSAADWQVEIDRRLERVLDAARRTPYYRGRLVKDGTGLGETPMTSKADVRADPESFRVPDFRGRTVLDRTSGTTGTPLEILHGRGGLLEWFSLFEARFKRWYGVSKADRWAMFGGQVVVPVGRTEPPFWVHNRPMRQLYVSTHHLSRANAPAFAEALCRFRPSYLLGYPSSMALLARYALEGSLRLPTVKVVLSNAEILRAGDRELLEAAFGAPVRNSYGMAEAAAGATECEQGSMHLWPEAGIIEVEREDGAISSEPGSKGPLVLTSLLNTAMPLIRYEVGDVGSVPIEADCVCGRTLPILGEVQGRSSDFIVTRDGRHVVWMNPVVADLPIAEAQFVQRSEGNVEVRVVVVSGWTKGHAEEVRARCERRLGAAMEIDVQLVDEITRDSSGKFRPIVSIVAEQN